MFKSRRRKKEERLANYSKAKKGSFNFNTISEYFIKKDQTAAFQVVSDKTYHDLDLDEVFMFIDRTLSKIGQQFLYNSFRVIPQNSERQERFEELISVFRKNPELKKTAIEQLSRLDSYEAYYISSLFLEDHSLKPKWFFIIPILSITGIISLSLSLFYPQFLILLVAILAINYFIHYWNKEKFVHYSGTILQLIILNQVVKEFVKSGIVAKSNEEVNNSIRSIDNIGFRMSLFKLEAKIQSDIGQAVDTLTDIVKALFLIEPIVFFSVLQKLNSKKDEIHLLFKKIGEIDTAISIDSLRNELPYYSVPILTGKKKYLSAREIYHPLLQDSVANSIAIDDKSVLLTGSNMSGKTTFIRTIGINCIVSQTLNTCFAREFSMPRIRVHSAIRISDDIMNDKSYYFEEVLTVKSMLEESRSGVQNLFLLDEMFKGTNSVERISAGKSILTYLNSENNIVFISTHDLELAEYLNEGYNLFHFTEIIKDKSIQFDFKIKAGQLKTTNAIRILELNNYPPEIIAEAIKLSVHIKSIKTK